MSEREYVLGGADYRGYVRIHEVTPGLVLLRGDAAVQALALAELGLAVPAQRRMIAAGGRMAGWMAPDEILLVLPVAEVAAVLARLALALVGRHHLLADISDSRVVLRLEGPRWREVLAKAVPVDLAPAVFGAGELRRAPAGQVPVAFWTEGDDAVLIAMRSVAGYVFDLLSVLARPGAEVGLFD